ncbi:SpoIIE family protein phosphatase [Streptomyces sp. NPDC001255]|uniref:SpoIIE family protein phosphatase n=1 Tax=Streptomyces sp. NPDC001255 TaxID=3364550 RepID=UPI00368BD508
MTTSPAPAQDPGSAAAGEGTAWLLVDASARPAESRVLEVSRRAARLLERVPDELVGAPLTALVAEGSLNSVIALLLEAASFPRDGTAGKALQPVEFTVPSGAVICTASARRPRGDDGVLLVRIEEKFPQRRWEALRLGVVLAGESLWLYDHDAERFRWLEGEPPFSLMGPDRDVSPEEFLARVHPHDLDSVAAFFDSLVSGRTDSGELLFRLRRSGEGAGYRKLHTRARAARFGFTGARRIVGTTEDTTTLVERLDALQAAYVNERKRGRLVGELASAFISAATEDELTEAVLHRLAPAFGGVGTLFAYGERGHLRVVFGDEIDQALAKELEGLPLSAPKPLPEAIRTGEALFIASREEYRERWPMAHSLLDATDAESFAMVPLRAAARQLGAWVITFHEPGMLTEGDRTLMRTLGTLAGQALERIRLQEARVELARIVQRNMLPEVLPPVPGVELTALYHPAQTGLDVGGDWYDVVPLQDGGAAFVIGDVQGHDLHAAGLMGQVRTALRAYAWQDPQPGMVLERTNELLLQMGVRAFTTCLYVRLMADGRLCTARAGHPPMVRLDAGGTATVCEDETGPPLGVLEGARYPEHAYDFSRGGVLALLTDGVVEGPRFTADEGLRRVGDLLALKAHEPLDVLAQYLMSTAGSTGHLDDSALLLVRGM